MSAVISCFRNQILNRFLERWKVRFTQPCAWLTYFWYNIEIFRDYLERKAGCFNAWTFILCRMQADWNGTWVHGNSQYDWQWKDVSGVVLEFTSHSGHVPGYAVSWRESRSSTELLPQSWFGAITLVLHNWSKHQMGILRRSILSW